MKKFSSTTQWYYSLSFILMTSLLSGFLYYVWKKQLYDMDKVEKFYHTNFMIGVLDKNGITENIKDLVKEKNPRAAIKEFDKLILMIEEIQNNYVSVDSIKFPFMEKMREAKMLLSGLVSYPTFSAITIVLEDKINSFYRYANENNWKTLLRMTERLKVRMTNLAGQDLDRLTSTNRKINQDLTIMKNIVETSNLTKELKTSIMIKLTSMEIELNMLTNYLRDWSKFNDTYNVFVKSYLLWPNTILTKLESMKSAFYNDAKMLLFIPLGIVFVAIFCLLLGPVIFYSNNKKNSKLIEEVVFDCISNGVINSNFTVNASFSKNFKVELEKAHHYVQKRMSFSSLFQVAMPFPCLLLDSNLRVIWANTHFCDSFNLKNFDSNKETLSWDFILRLTNITDVDPVCEALNKNVCGTHQINVKVGQNLQSSPFEMYVTPVDTGKVKRVLLTFYPLIGLEETINNQGMSLIGPIRKSLDALTQSHFDADFQQSISREFAKVGTQDIYSKILDLYEMITTQKQGFLSEFDRLEDEIRDYHKILCDIGDKNQVIRKGQQNVGELIHGTKNGVVGLVEINQELSTFLMQYFDSIREQISKNKTIFTKFDVVFEKINTFTQCVGSLNNLKADLKQAKVNIKNINTKLNQSIDQSMVFEKSPIANTNDAIKLDQSFSKVKNDMKILENECKNLEKLITLFDVQIAKANMILDNSADNIGLDALEHFKLDYFSIDKLLSISMERIQEFLATCKKMEEGIVTPINGIYTVFKDSTNVISEMDHIITSFTVPNKAKLTSENQMLSNI